MATTDGDSVAQLAVVVLLLMLSVPTLATAHELAGTPFEYEETVVVDYNSTTQVSQNATVEGYSENVSIVNEETGNELTAGDDYQWYPSNGTIEWVDNSNSADGDSATVEYAAYQRTAETEAAWLIIGPLMGLFGLFSLVSAVRVLWSYSAEVFDA